MKNTVKTIIGIALATGTLTAQAQGIPFSVFDTDNNGVVSEQEFNQAKAKHIASKAKEGRQMRGLANSPSFASLDLNQDGKLTPDEIQQMSQGRGNKGQGRGMGNGQGKGLGRPPQPVFADFDANMDNYLTEQEYYEARNKRIGERAKEGRQMRGLANIASFADLDKNNDGKVSQDEFASFKQEHMKKGH